MKCIKIRFDDRAFYVSKKSTYFIIEDKKINNEIKYHCKHDKQIYTIAADEAVNDTEIIQNPLIMFVL